MDVQEYLDRQDRYKIIFFFADNTWNAVQVNINGWDMVSPVRGDMKGLYTIKVKELANFARILLKD